MFLLIALLHGVVVWWVSLFFPTKKAVLTTAAVMAAIGALTGSPIYTGLDLLGVALFTVICFKQIKTKQAKEAVEMRAHIEQVKKWWVKDEAEALAQGAEDGWDTRNAHMDRVIAARAEKRALANAKREAFVHGGGTDKGAHGSEPPSSARPDGH